jgi:hypothetical protein
MTEEIKVGQTPGAGRFDYVKYDAEAIVKQNDFKCRFSELAYAAETTLPKGRAQALVLTALEEAYMWVGKAIRDEQVLRNAGAELQEGRGNE